MSQFNNCTYYGNEKDMQVIKFLESKKSNNNIKIPPFNYESNKNKKKWVQRLIEFLIQLYHEKLCVCVSEALFNNMFNELIKKDSTLKNNDKQLFYNISYKFYNEMKVGIEKEIPNQLVADQKNYNNYSKNIKTNGYRIYEKMISNLENSVKKKASMNGGKIKSKTISDFKKNDLTIIAKRNNVSLYDRNKKVRSKEQLYRSLKYYKFI